MPERDAGAQDPPTFTPPLGTGDTEDYDRAIRIWTTGFSRSRIYELIACGEIQIAKDRRSTLIIVASLREAVRRRVVGDLPIG
jgi:hypothetical protein